MRAQTQCSVVARDLLVAVEKNYERLASGSVHSSTLISEVETHDRGLLVRDGDGNIVDAWGRPLRITISVENKDISIGVGSCGADGTFGTEDDCRVDRTYLLPVESEKGQIIDLIEIRKRLYPPSQS
jgi:hypothetical protein